VNIIFALNLADRAKSGGSKFFGTLLPREVLLAKVSKLLICTPFRCFFVVSLSIWT